eukprot:TRINITY_DN110430_c0_g1_i1.p1 TRINITY_DN110430_c0_g1~~TRINITY_DN110430_c0_g1_i1.p1  ORF type:complete len:453 (-),score=113.90 TRINITY_DN110430_c0_g1_i1:117-1274(-)
MAIRYASKDLCNDWELVAEAVCRDGEALKFASKQLKNDLQLVHLAIGFDMPEEDWLGRPFEVRDVDDLALQKLASRYPQRCFSALRHISDEIRGQATDMMLQAIKESWFAAEYVELPMCLDKRFWQRVMEENTLTGWMAYCNYAPTGLRDDKSLFEMALKADPAAMHYAGPKLCVDRAWMLKAIGADWRCLRTAPEEIRSDREVLLCAAKQDLLALTFATGLIGEYVKEAANPDFLERDRRNAAVKAAEFKADVNTGMPVDPLAVGAEEERLAAEKAEADKEWKEMILSLVENNARAFSLANASLSADLTLEAVKLNGRCLAYAPENLKQERDLVNQAVKTQIGICSGLVWRDHPHPDPDKVAEKKEKEREGKKKAKGKAAPQKK